MIATLFPSLHPWPPDVSYSLSEQVYYNKQGNLVEPAIPWGTTPYTATDGSTAYPCLVSAYAPQAELPGPTRTCRSHS